MADDILLTGLPRSGTTLACELLNTLPGVVALDEPFRGDAFAAGLRQGGAAFLRGELARVREQLETTGRAVTVHVDGRVTGDRVSHGRRRRSVAEHGEVAFADALAPGLVLVVKHTALFTAVLGELASAFSCFALVRNPVAVLCSWRTVPFPVRDGRLPEGEAVSPALAEVVSVRDRTERQVALLDWLFRQYVDHLPRERVLRYEDLAEAVPFEDRNASYPRRERQVIAQLLAERDGSWRRFYDAAELSDLARRD